MSLPIVDTIPGNELQFGIRNPAQNPANNPRRNGFQSVQRVRPVNAGATAVTLTAQQLMNPTILINPSALTNYTLPNANQLIAEFGRNLDTGVSNVANNDCIHYKVINIGSATGTILPSNTGGTGNSVMGVAPSGVKGFTLRFQQVGSSIQGTTGVYWIHPDTN